MSGDTSSSAIMLKLPTDRLNNLRADFEKTDGLDLDNFLKVILEHMDFVDDAEILATIPAIIDFFVDVDINGDGTMEWSEFVLFVIAGVVREKSFNSERLKLHMDMVIQPPASRMTVKCCKMIPQLKRIFVSLGNDIQIYAHDEKSPNWLTPPYKLALQNISKYKPKAEGGTMAKSDKKDKMKVSAKKQDDIDSSVSVVDLAYIPSKDIICILRSDLCVEFQRFISRNKISAELVDHLGIWQMNLAYSKIEVRDVAKETWKFFAIGVSKVIDTWTMVVTSTGMIELEDYKPMIHHKDYVLDILVIYNSLYKIFVSCGMDRKVILWDLVRLEYRATRNGHSAGVQCLAYDGKSVLLAGGYDYSVIGWDLDAEIDRPLFNLVGHQSPVIQVVGLGHLDRCLSLDTSGEIRYWDTCKTSSIDKEERQIDAFHINEDHLRTMEVIQHASARYKGAVLVAQGRRQHIYSIEDTSPKESPPFCVLFSYEILSIITVHIHDIIMWNAVTGAQTHRMAQIGGASMELTAAVLDDRHRKVIVGDSSGLITVYNAITGVVLKKLPPLPYAVRHMIYSDDKTIIAVAGQGDIFILDELPNDDESPEKIKLRDVKASEIDVVSIAYSRNMGLIATADCMGTIYIWDYLFLSLEAMIEDCTGTEIGQLIFMDPYPLLLVPDALGNFTILFVGPCASVFGKRVWRLETVVQKGDSVLESLRCVQKRTLSRPPTPGTRPVTPVSEEDGEEDENTGEGEDKEPGENGENGEDEGSGDGEKKVNESESDSSDDDKDSKAIKAHEPLSYRLMNRFLQQRRVCKSILLHCEYDDEEEEEEESDDENGDEDDSNMDGAEANDMEALERTRVVYAEAVDNCLHHHVENSGDPTACHVFDDEASVDSMPIISKKKVESLKSDIIRSDSLQEMLESRIAQLNLAKSVDSDSDDDQPTSGLMGGFSSSNHKKKKPTRRMYRPFPYNVQMFAYCGHEDGYISVTNLTDALADINIRPLTKAEFVYNAPGYNPRSMCQKTVKEADTERAKWDNEEIVAHEKYTSGNLERVWPAHKAAIWSMSFVGDRTELLTASDDLCVQLWQMTGKVRAVLTRGSEWDLVFNPRWKSPIDMDARAKRRHNEALKYVNDLGLKWLDPSKYDDRWHKKNYGTGHGNHMTSVTLPGISGLINEGQHNTRHGPVLSNDMSQIMSASEYNRMSDGDRLLGQLAGIITYEQSNKDIANSKLLSKHMAAMEMIATIGQKKRKKKRSEMVNYGTTLKKDTKEDDRYLESVNFDTGSIIRSGKQLGDAMGGMLATKKKDKKSGGDTRYDSELAAIDASDPHNWEIHSSNRQRSLYSKLYSELDRAGLSQDKSNPSSLQSKLNHLAPGGSFADYEKVMRDKRNKNKPISDTVQEADSSEEDSDEDSIERQERIKEEKQHKKAALDHLYDLKPALSLDLTKLKDDQNGAKDQKDKDKSISKSQPALAATIKKALKKEPKKKSVTSTGVGEILTIPDIFAAPADPLATTASVVEGNELDDDLSMSTKSCTTSVNPALSLHPNPNLNFESFDMEDSDVSEIATLAASVASDNSQRVAGITPASASSPSLRVTISSARNDASGEKRRKSLVSKLLADGKDHDFVKTEEHKTKLDYLFGKIQHLDNGSKSKMADVVVTAVAVNKAVEPLLASLVREDSTANLQPTDTQIAQLQLLHHQTAQSNSRLKPGKQASASPQRPHKGLGEFVRSYSTNTIGSSNSKDDDFGDLPATTSKLGLVYKSRTNLQEGGDDMSRSSFMSTGSSVASVSSQERNNPSSWLAQKLPVVPKGKKSSTAAAMAGGHFEENKKERMDLLDSFEKKMGQVELSYKLTQKARRQEKKRTRTREKEVSKRNKHMRGSRGGARLEPLDQFASTISSYNSKSSRYPLTPENSGFVASDTWSRKIDFCMKGDRGMEAIIKHERSENLHTKAYRKAHANDDPTALPKIKEKKHSAHMQGHHRTKIKRELTDREIQRCTMFGPYDVAELLKLWRMFIIIPKSEKFHKAVLDTDDPDEDMEVLVPKAGIVPKTSEVIHVTPFDSVFMTDILHHPVMRASTHFKNDLHCFMEGKVTAHQASVDLSQKKVLHEKTPVNMMDIITALCPFMSSEDRKDCMRYFAFHQPNPDDFLFPQICAANCSVSTGGGANRNMAPSNNVLVSAEDIEKLRGLFNFFDVDCSGYIDQEEIMNVLSSHGIANTNSILKRMKGDVEYDGQINSLDINQNAVEKMMHDGDTDDNLQLDFKEFVYLFKDTLCSVD